MSKYLVIIKFFFLLIVLLMSCESDEGLVTLDKYQSGILISNEGNFSDADGSITFFDNRTQEVIPKIFEAENQRPFGGLLQSIGVHGDFAYLIDNLGSQIEIVDVTTFMSLEPITEGLSLPRYFAAEGELAFISNWGPYAEDFSSPSSFIAVLDTRENLLGQQIEVPSRPEGMIIINNKLYVSSLASSSITIIDLGSLEKIGQIATPFGPSHFVMDKNEQLWVSCTEGALIKIDPSSDVIQDEIEVANLDGKTAIDGSGQIIYLLTNTYAPDFSYTENEVVKVDVDSQTSVQSIYTSQNLYGIGINPETNLIYLGNSNAFLGNGTVIVIDSEGNEVDNFPAGRGPNGFVFRK